MYIKLIMYNKVDMYIKMIKLNFPCTGFLRLFTVSFKCGLISLKYSLIDSVLFYQQLIVIEIILY